MGYFAWVALGVVAAAIASRWQGRSTQLAANERQALLFAALAGAIVGAFGLQLPADLMHWCAPPPAGVAGDAMPLGGRTVLGGLIGGWLGVEVIKKLAHITQSTGGDFALPLAIALGFGRLGCLTAGCCAGVACAPGWFATVDALGTPRVPTQVIEATFQFVAAVVLAIAARRRWRASLRLPIYFAAYAVLRFTIEFWRLQPVVALGLTWHQFLAVLLFVMAVTAWWRRSNQRPNSTPPNSRP